MPEFIAIPDQGVGPVRLGMKRTEVAVALNATALSFRKDRTDEHETDAFDDMGFHVYYTGDPEVVEFIEVFPVEHTRFTLFSVDVLNTPAVVVVDCLCSQMSMVEEEGSTYSFLNWDVALWRQQADQLYFDALGVGSAGYYGIRTV